MMTIFPYPPIRSAAAARHLFVGADPQGRWIVRDAQGEIDAHFGDRDAAMRFAAMESDRAEAAVTILSGDVAIAAQGAILADNEAPYRATAAALLI